MYGLTRSPEEAKSSQMPHEIKRPSIMLRVVITVRGIKRVRVRTNIFLIVRVKKVVWV